MVFLRSGFTDINPEGSTDQEPQTVIVIQTVTVIQTVWGSNCYESSNTNGLQTINSPYQTINSPYVER